MWASVEHRAELGTLTPGPPLNFAHGDAVIMVLSLCDNFLLQFNSKNRCLSKWSRCFLSLEKRLVQWDFFFSQLTKFSK